MPLMCRCLRAFSRNQGMLFRISSIVYYEDNEEKKDPWINRGIDSWLYQLYHLKAMSESKFKKVNSQTRVGQGSALTQQLLHESAYI